MSPRKKKKTNSSSSPPPVGAEDDRLSSLPDDVLHHILSFLPNTRNRACTSVLSSRYRHLWAHHPSILLTLPYNITDKPTVARYISRVDLCLASHSLSLDLTLVTTPSSKSHNPRSANRWLRKVSIRSPSLSSLHLSGNSSDSSTVNLPPPVFTSFPNLISLQVISLSIPSVPPTTDFPSLTTLHLITCGGIDDQTLSSLLSKCPSIRSLFLKCCPNLTFLHLSSIKLRDLHIKDHWINYIRQVRIEDAPYLTSLEFRGDINNLCFDNTPQLVHVDISHFSFDVDPTFLSTFDDWMRPITSISHSPTNKLCVNDWLFKFLLPRATIACAPLFGDLRMLHCRVDLGTIRVLDGLTSLLGHCINLEHLNILSRGSSSIDWKEDEKREIQGWDPLKGMEDNQDIAHNLRTITLKSFTCTPSEIKMIEFLLARAIILEKLHIQHSLNHDVIEEISQLLSSIPRASPHVQICVRKIKMVHFDFESIFDM